MRGKHFFLALFIALWFQLLRATFRDKFLSISLCSVRRPAVVDKFVNLLPREVFDVPHEIVELALLPGGDLFVV